MANCGFIGSALCAVATVGILYCLASRYWKINSQVASQGRYYGVQEYEGLWVRCSSNVVGFFQCDKFDKSIFELEATLHAQRGMMVTASILAFGGLLGGCLGLNCVHAVRRRQKVYSARGGGILFFVSSVLTLSTVSWYAADVVKDFHAANGDYFKYHFGAALYVGWVASALGLIGAGLVTFCETVYEDDEYYATEIRDGYGGHSARATEYV